MSFKIKTTTKMRRVFSAYASKHYLDPANLRFEVSGAAVTGNVAVASNDTAHSLNLNDGDTLKCIWTYTGATPAFLQIPGFHLYTGGVAPEELRPEMTCVCIAPQVRCIPPGAFSGCAKLEYVHLNEGLQVIEKDAFRGCMALRSVTMPSTVFKLGNYAFQGCRNLAEVRLNEGLQTIEGHAFAHCLGLRSVTIPSTVTKLGARAFYLCSDMSDIILLGGERLLDLNSSPVVCFEKSRDFSIREHSTRSYLTRAGILHLDVVH